MASFGFSFHSITVGEQTEFQRVLADAGLDATDVRRIIKDPTLAAEMVRALGERVPAFPSWFVRTEHQRADVYAFCKDNDYGFIYADVPESPRVWTPPTPTSVMMLMPYAPGWDPKSLSGLHRTYRDLLRKLVYRQGREFGIEDALRGDSYEFVSSRDTWTTGIRWVWFDPCAYQGLSPREARKQAASAGVQLAGVEVLMAMKLFPRWVESWDGRESPYPSLSGLTVSRPVAGLTPAIGMLPSTLTLHAAPSEISSPSYASPTIRPVE